MVMAKDILSVTRALRRPPPRSCRLADGEESKLLSALADAAQPELIVRLTLETGRRLQELMQTNDDLLTKRDGRCFLRVLDNKTGDNLSVPLSPEARWLLSIISPDYFTIRRDSVSQAFAKAVGQVCPI